jgi:hypothetical protein
VIERHCPIEFLLGGRVAIDPELHLAETLEADMAGVVA